MLACGRIVIVILNADRMSIRLRVNVDNEIIVIIGNLCNTFPQLQPAKVGDMDGF